MKKSRQEQGFELFKETFLKLVLADKNLQHPVEIEAELREFLGAPGISDAMLQAFTNFMWFNDDRVQADVVSELKNVLALVPKVADPEDKNTKQIVATLEQIIETTEEPTDFQTAEELMEEFPDSEFDEIGGLGPDENKSLL